MGNYVPSQRVSATRTSLCANDGQHEIKEGTLCFIIQGQQYCSTRCANFREIPIGRWHSEINSPCAKWINGEVNGYG